MHTPCSKKRHTSHSKQVTKPLATLLPSSANFTAPRLISNIVIPFADLILAPKLALSGG
jgi:hypothetical protein